MCTSTPSKPWPWLLAAAALACSSPDSNIQKLSPDITAAPGSVEFGDVVVLYSDTQQVQILNAGKAPLDVADIRVSGEDGVFAVTPSTFSIDESESIALDVTFAPPTYGEYRGALRLESNDPDSPFYLVDLTGNGVDGPVPDIDFDTLSLDFGQVTVGDTSRRYFTILNNGDGPLTLGTLASTGSSAFRLVADPSGQTIAGGGYLAVLVDYEPELEGGDNAALAIPSDDPDEAESQVILLGNGGGDFGYPVAAIDCPSKVDPPITVDLDGTASTDPNGFLPLTWKWKLVDSPSGSTSDILDDDASFTSLFADLAGDYEVQLTVTNSVGIESEPAVCQFKGKPDSSLHVELVWNTGDSDVDLHLIQDGYDFLETPGDCCWCNPNPSWGETSSSDDPELSLDNRVGYGPENIRVDDPYLGRYFVKVHYFEDSGGGTTTATVRWWLDGELEAEVSENITHNRVWDVGFVDWPEGAITMQANSLWKPDSKECD